MVTLEKRFVVYCGACGMPLEYCPFGPDYETHCNPWLIKHHPELYKAKTTSSNVSNKKSSTRIDECKSVPTTVLDNVVETQADAPQSKEKQRSNNNNNNNNNTNLIVKPTRPWTTEERLVAFYQKYQPDKVDGVSNLLEKYVGKELQLFTALISKYGPEPFDPYYAEDEEENDDNEEEDDDDEEEEKDDDNVKEKGVDMSKLSIHQNQQQQQEEKSSTTALLRRGVSAKTTFKIETRVIIQKISRNRKKAITSVIGMDTVPDIKLKDVSKAFSKKFAGASSVKDLPNGKKEIILQGDHMDEVALMVVEQFHVKPDVVFLDIDGEFVPFVEH